MRQIIVASHHGFSQGLKDTLEFIGGVGNMIAIAAYMDDTPIATQVEKAFSDLAPDDEVLVLTDIRQGSVNQAFAPYMGEHVFLVTGVNVPLALELALMDGRLTSESIERAIEDARSQMALMNTLVVEEGEDDE